MTLHGNAAVLVEPSLVQFQNPPAPASRQGDGLYTQGKAVLLQVLHAAGSVLANLEQGRRQGCRRNKEGPYKQVILQGLQAAGAVLTHLD